MTRNATLTPAVNEMFASEPVPMARDARVLVLEPARGLLEEAPGGPGVRAAAALDMPGLGRGRPFADAELDRGVRSGEPERVAGLNRYEFARRFRIRHGTSPYRCSLRRRLGAVRRCLLEGDAIAALAARYALADQARLTRQFHATFGLTPFRFRRRQGASRVTARLQTLI